MAAEEDAWSAFGVDNVINEIEGAPLEWIRLRPRRADAVAVRRDP